MKVENMKGSHWSFDHEVIQKEGKDEIVRHYLKTTVNYKDENGNDAQSFSRIPMDSSFFPKVEKDDEKKTLNSFDHLVGIKDILKDGSFDMDSIQRNAAVGKKAHVEWKIIPSFEELASDSDKRVLVLGGYKGDSVWFDRRGSQNVNTGRSVIVAYSQAYDKAETQDENNEGKRIIREVQFAALLDEGDCVAYRITRTDNRGTRRFIAVIRNTNGKIRFETKSPYAWTQELIERGLVKMPSDRNGTLPKKGPKQPKVEVKAAEEAAPTGEDAPDSPSDEGKGEEAEK